MKDIPLGFGLSALAIPGGAARSGARLRPATPGRSAEVVPLFGPLRVGIISNPRSHRNKLQHGAQLGDIGDALHASPRTPDDLAAALADFAAQGVDVLAVDGGDGTVRDVITIARHFFPKRLPRLAVVPSGKTNALALDLGIPAGATLPMLLEGARQGRFVQRSPIEVHRNGDAMPEVRGFLFGAGAFLRATGLAQRTHGWGAIDDLAVGLSVGWGIAQTMFARPDNAWRAGDAIRIATDGAPLVEASSYIVFASTLIHLPLGMRPFGPPREGLKLLTIDAPPQRILRNAARLLSGSQSPVLARDGYHRADVGSFDIQMDGGFILDGEVYPGGDLTVLRGAPLHFAVP